MLHPDTTCREEAGEGGSEVRRESGVRLLAQGENDGLVKDISDTFTQVNICPCCRTFSLLEPNDPDSP